VLTDGMHIGHDLRRHPHRKSFSPPNVRGITPLLRGAAHPMRSAISVALAGTG
jgi:hypothetical protein